MQSIVTTSTQTSPGYNEYTNLSRLSRVHKPLQVIPVSISPWDQDQSRIKETLSKERTMKTHKGLLHNGEELHNSFTQPKLYMLSITIW